MASLRVLMYHKVAIATQDFLTVSAKQLEEQLIYLQSKYQFVKLSDIVNHLENGQKLPDNALHISFDDGFENNYELAYPIFKKLKIPFSIFLVANFVGKTIDFDGAEQSFLNIAKLQEMQDLVEYGYHSYQHDNLMDITPSMWENEIQSTRAFFERKHLAMQAIWAYTYGQYPKKDKNLMQKLAHIFQQNAIVGAFRIGNRINQLPLNNNFEIERIDIRGNQSYWVFKQKVRFGKMFF